MGGTGFDYQDTGKAYVLGMDYDTRINILRQAQTSFLVSIIVVQWTDVMICKTRTLSILEQGMRNTVLLIGLVEELLLGLMLVYVPFAHAAFKTQKLDFVMWTYGIPFAFLILLFDEVRKFFLREERKYYAERAAEGELPEVGFIEACTYY